LALVVEGDLVAVLRHPDERRRGRDRRNCTQLHSGGVGALVVEMAHEVTAAEHRLGHRGHHLADAETSPS